MLNPVVSRSAILATAVLLLGCNRGGDAPSIPLGQAAAEARPITGEARVALDSANLLFRARSYDLALVQYRRSAQLVPDDVTPLIGILMVAEATGDTQLTESTLARIRELDPEAADASTAKSHSQLIETHPRPAAPPPHP